jgi:hypothetical protein
MKRSGMPTTTECQVRYTEVVENLRLGYVHLADFIPGVEPYDVATLVELHQTSKSVRMVLTFDAMHDEQWTKRAVMGWDSELSKLENALAAIVAQRGSPNETDR